MRVCFRAAFCPSRAAAASEHRAELSGRGGGDSETAERRGESPSRLTRSAGERLTRTDHQGEVLVHKSGACVLVRERECECERLIFDP